MAQPTRHYRVLAKQYVGDGFREVYRTDNEENASCFAESHFINRHAFAVQAVNELDVPLTDRRSGRSFTWQRLNA